MGQLLMAGGQAAQPPPSRASTAGPPSRSSVGSFDLLGEAQLLMAPAPIIRRPSAPPPPPPANSHNSHSNHAQPNNNNQPPLPRPSSRGAPVDALPADWALKRGCLVSSASSLEWCATPPPSVRAAALRHGEQPAGSSSSAADGSTSSGLPHVLSVPLSGASHNTALALALERSLLHFRHPAARLPPAVLKQLAAPALGSAEREYAESLNDAWDTSLRSLYAALRDGRLPYFYCRSEPSSRDGGGSTAATSGFTVLWRNTAVPDAADGSEMSDSALTGAAAQANDGGGGGGGGGAVPLPLGWAASDSTSCYAVLTPTSRGLRQALYKHGVSFEMPLAPPGMRLHESTIIGGAGAGGAGGGGGEAHKQQEEEDTPGRDAATLEELNRGRSAEVQPDSDAGIQHQLSALDYKSTSTLVIHGRSALHALHEFLINYKPSPNPYFLTLQLLSPMPFVNGAPHAPRIVHTRRELLRGAANGDGGGGGGAGSGQTEETIKFEDVERGGGGALILPGALRKLIHLLRHTQPHGFEVVVQPDAGGASSDALNAKPSQQALTPQDLLYCVRAKRVQPEAELLVPGGEQASPYKPPERPSSRGENEPPTQRQKTLHHVVGGRDGELYVG